MNAQVIKHVTRALTEREVADLLGLSVATLRAWRHRGQGPRFLRLGRAVRYLPNALTLAFAVVAGTLACRKLFPDHGGPELLQEL